MAASTEPGPGGHRPWSRSLAIALPGRRPTRGGQFDEGASLTDLPKWATDRESRELCPVQTDCQRIGLKSHWRRTGVRNALKRLRCALVATSRRLYSTEPAQPAALAPWVASPARDQCGQVF